MRSRVSVTRATRDSPVRKWLARVEVPRLWQRSRHLGCMAVQAPRVHRKSQRHLVSRLKVRGHVPELLLAIPVDWRFEPIPVLLKQIGAAPLARANKIFQ